MCSNYPGIKLELALGNLKFNICHPMVTSSTQLQNRSFHVVERTSMSSKCQKMKNVKYVNVWVFVAVVLVVA